MTISMVSKGCHKKGHFARFSIIMLTSKSKNCGPPPDKFDFDLEVDKMSWSPHGTNRMDLSKGSCMPNINALSFYFRRYE